MELNFYFDGRFGVDPEFICKVENAQSYPQIQTGEIIEFQDSYGDKLKKIIGKNKSLTIRQIKHCIHPEKGMTVNIYCC